MKKLLWIFMIRKRMKAVIRITKGDLKYWKDGLDNRQFHEDKEYCRILIRIKTEVIDTLNNLL